MPTPAHTPARSPRYSVAARSSERASAYLCVGEKMYWLCSWCTSTPWTCSRKLRSDRRQGARCARRTTKRAQHSYVRCERAAAATTWRCSAGVGGCPVESVRLSALRPPFCGAPRHTESRDEHASHHAACLPSRAHRTARFTIFCAEASFCAPMCAVASVRTTKRRTKARKETLQRDSARPFPASPPPVVSKCKCCSQGKGHQTKPN